jgi:hypothetical protein
LNVMAWLSEVSPLGVIAWLSTELCCVAFVSKPRAPPGSAAVSPLANAE